MNHLESVFTGKNNLWRYIVMLAIVFIATNIFGALPFLIVFAIKSLSNPAIISKPTETPFDINALGIDPNISLAMLIFPFIAGLVAFTLVIKPLHNRTLKNVINGTGNIRWNRFFISAFVWFLLSAVYLLVFTRLNPENFLLNNTSNSLIILAFVSILFIPFQAGLEEILFRGYFMQGFASVCRNRWFPLVMSSLFFGLLHSFNPEVKALGFLTMMPQYILFGLIFGLITIFDDGIEAAMGAHAANNIFLCILLTNKSASLQTPALYEQLIIYPWTDLIALLLIGLLFIFILSRVFGWVNYSILFKKIKI
jgi:hypothetical protein